MRRSILIVILATAAALAAFAHAGQRPRAGGARVPAGKVVGVVLDRYDARVANASVKFSGRDYRREVTSDSEGGFTVELPAGEYVIEANAPGFRKFELSPFKVKPATSELINIHLEVAPPSDPHVIVEPPAGAPN